MPLLSSTTVSASVRGGINTLDPSLRSRRDRQLTLRVAAIACIVSCCLVVLDLWDNRDLFDPEGITFLDMADAYRRGDWRAALIGLWSPLYPWLLALMMFFFNPSAQWEFTAVHALNFFIYLVTLTSFCFVFRDVGAKAVVATNVPAGSAPADWQQIEDTGYYAYVFPRTSVNSQNRDRLKIDKR